jgi:glycine cleavage system pyridoxal-binding protein P
MATIYTACMGKRGLRHVAELCYQKAHYAAGLIAQLPGYRSIQSHFATRRGTRLMVTRGTAVVYSAEQARLREITSSYRATLNVRLGPAEQ